MLREFHNKNGQEIYIDVEIDDVESIKISANGLTILQTKKGFKHFVRESPKEVFEILNSESRLHS